jgi:hypothetical protein
MVGSEGTPVREDRTVASHSPGARQSRSPLASKLSPAVSGLPRLRRSPSGDIGTFTTHALLASRASYLHADSNPGSRHRVRFRPSCECLILGRHTHEGGDVRGIRQTGRNAAAFCSQFAQMDDVVSKLSHYKSVKAA